MIIVLEYIHTCNVCVVQIRVVQTIHFIQKSGLLIDSRPRSRKSRLPRSLSSTIRRVYLLSNLCKHVALLKRQCL